MGAVRTEMPLTETNVHHSEDSATCAVPCLAPKGHVLSQPLHDASWCLELTKWRNECVFFCGSIQSVKPSYGKNTNRTHWVKAVRQKSFHQYLIFISSFQVSIVVVSSLKLQSVHDPVLFNSLCSVSRQCLGDRKDLPHCPGSFDDLPRQWDHSHDLSWLLSKCLYWSKYWSSWVRALTADLIEMLFLKLSASQLTSSGKFK